MNERTANRLAARWRHNVAADTRPARRHPTGMAARRHGAPGAGGALALRTWSRQ